MPGDYLAREASPFPVASVAKTAGLIIGLVVLTLGGIGVGILIVRPPAPRPDPKPVATAFRPAPEVAINATADTLVEEFHDNEIAANDRYVGRLIEVSGVVSDVDDSGLLSGPQVNLRPFSRVMCQFPREARATVIHVRKGDRVTIRGRVKGKFFISVILIDCVLLGPSD